MRLATGLAFIAGVAVATSLAMINRDACSAKLTWLDSERIAREGKTDAEFYAFHPGHFAKSATLIRAKDTAAHEPTESGAAADRRH